jgi:hypothetical protein
VVPDFGNPRTKKYGKQIISFSFSSNLQQGVFNFDSRVAGFGGWKTGDRFNRPLSKVAPWDKHTVSAGRCTQKIVYILALGPNFERGLFIMMHFIGDFP